MRLEHKAHRPLMDLLRKVALRSHGSTFTHGAVVVGLAMTEDVQCVRALATHGSVQQGNLASRLAIVEFAKCRSIIASPWVGGTTALTKKPAHDRTNDPTARDVVEDEAPLMILGAAPFAADFSSHSLRTGLATSAFAHLAASDARVSA
jgi:hypothetical protein